MNIIKVLAIIAVGAVLFSLLGGVVGGMLGLAAPDYYRSVYCQGQSPGFNPFHFGIALGATQGFAAGVAISLVVLTLLLVRDVRMAKPLAGNGSLERKSRRWTVFAIWFVTTSLLVVVLGGGAFCVGRIQGETQAYQAWAKWKTAKVEEIVKAQGLANLQCAYVPPAQVYLAGVVPSQDDMAGLHRAISRAFGNDEADFMLKDVEVRSPNLLPAGGSSGK